jgi:hypothetical protein
MTGGGDEVAVARQQIEVAQAREGGKGIGH